MDYGYQRAPSAREWRAPHHPNGVARQRQREALESCGQPVAAVCWARLTSYTPGTSRIARMRPGRPAASGSCSV